MELYQGQLRLFRADPVAVQKFLKIGDRPPAPGLDPDELAAADSHRRRILNLDAAVMTR